MKVLSIFGTRPEAIKMAPVLRELDRRSRRDKLESVVCVAAQHREMLDQVLERFHIVPEIDLNLMRWNQTPASFSARALPAITGVLRRQKPDMLLVQGDTTTAMVAALAAFYLQIPVGHVEAGLRTHSLYNPFPEEVNRRIISVVAKYHFAPTKKAVESLQREGVPRKDVFLTGNTVIDSLLWVLRQKPSRTTALWLKRFDLWGRQNRSNRGRKGRIILVTAHRRENFGAPLERICRALLALVERNPNVRIIYPVHMNPRVSQAVARILEGQPRINLIEPLAYEPFAHLMKLAYLIITDSGGVQEEAPALGKPVLVIREETERPEAVEAGCARLVGTQTERILEETERLLNNEREYKSMARVMNPYGDGNAAKRIVDAIAGK